jgi:hypothetical protein
MIFPLPGHNVTTSNQIEVVSDQTSGEVEFVLLLNEYDIYVGVGSDHTDRAIEKKDLLVSKQVCPNVMSSQVWRYEDVKNGWDDMFLQSWVRLGESDEEVLYQEASLATIISPDDMISLVKSRIMDGQCDGLVIFSGTVPLLTNEIVHGCYFRGVLTDPRLDRVLRCEYEIKQLSYLRGVKID